jgi:hypothetical protein
MAEKKRIQVNDSQQAKVEKAAQAKKTLAIPDPPKMSSVKSVKK